MSCPGHCFDENGEGYCGELEGTSLHVDHDNLMTKT